MDWQGIGNFENWEFCLFRDDCSIFDGLMDEDEKDKAKR